MWKARTCCSAWLSPPAAALAGARRSRLRVLPRHVRLHQLVHATSSRLHACLGSQHSDKPRLSEASYVNGENAPGILPLRLCHMHVSRQVANRPNGMECAVVNAIQRPAHCIRVSSSLARPTRSWNLLPAPMCVPRMFAASASRLHRWPPQAMPAGRWRAAASRGVLLSLAQYLAGNKYLSASTATTSGSAIHPTQGPSPGIFRSGCILTHVQVRKPARSGQAGTLGQRAHSAHAR